MAKYSNVVEYNIVTDVDTSGIIKLQNELTKLKQSLKFDKNNFNQLGFDDAKIDKSIHKVNQLQTALTAAFNPKIGTIDLSKLNASLQREHTSLQMIVKDWEQMGTRGTMAISNLSNALLSMNKGVMNVNTTLSKVANTFGNTVRWGITAGIFQEMLSSVQGAVSYMKDLDESLTQIQMVTNSSKEDMRELAQYANNAAQALGSTTVDYTNAVKVFVQEGFSESESKQYANLSTKLANVSEQSTAVTSDQITAYRNAFQLDYQQTVEAMDKVANVANSTASNVNELMTASQRAASVAQAVGSSQDSFLAAIATIESVTRQSAEEIGNGLKTIYQRFADIKVSGSTDDGVDYGQYAKALQQVGVDVLDVSGQFKGMDQILKELQDVWSTLDDTMKIAVGEKVAGKFQYNRFAALMNNPEYYQKALAATQNAGGMMDQMNEYYMEGIEGRLKTLQAAGEQVMSTLFDQDNIEPMIEQVTELVNGLNSMVDAAGGLTGVIQVLGAVMLRTFNTQIAGTISNIATAISTVTANSRNANQLQTTAQLVGLSNYTQSQNAGSVAGKLVAGVANNYNSLSDKTQGRIKDLSQQIVELEEQKTGILKEQEKFFKQIAERAIEEKNIKEQQIEIEREILAQKRDNEKITQEQYEDEILKLDVLEDENLVYEKIRKEANDLAKAIAQGGHADDEMIAKLQQMRRESAGLGINIAELESLIEQFGVAENNLDIGESMVKDTIQAADFEAHINSVVKTLSGVTSVVFGFSMISDMFKTLTDDSATLEEQLNAVTMNGLMGLTMLLPGLVSLTNGIKELTKAYILENVAIVARNEKERESIALKMIDAGWTRKAVAAKALEIAARIANIPVLIAENAQLLIQKILQGGLITIIPAVAVAIGGLAIGVAAATKAWIDNYGAAAQANKEYEEQKELLGELKHNYDEINENITKLKESIGSINDKRKALDDLKEGTLEWKEAVIALNQEVLNLLETYPKLAESVKNENGILSFEEGELDKFYEQQLDTVRSAQNMITIQQARTYSASSDSAIANFAEQNSNISHTIPKEVLETFVNGINEGSIDIKEACEKLGLDVDENGDELIELAETVKSNTVAVDALNATFEDTTNYQSYAPTPDSEEAYQQAYDALGEKYGSAFNGADSLIASIADNRNGIVNQQDFKDIAQGALPELEGTITSIREAADSWDWVIRTSANEEIHITKQALQEKMALYQAEQDIERQKFDFDTKIYEALGAKWNKETQNFEGGFQLNEQQAQLIKDYQSNKEIQVGDQLIGFADYMATQGYDSVDKFCKALADSEGKLFEFSENLSNIQTATSLSDLEYEKAKQEEQGPLTSEQQTNYDTKLNELTEQAAKAYDIDLEDIIDQAKAFREELELTEGAARDLAIQNQRMTRGIDTLYDNWEKWSDILQNSNHAAKDYIDASQEATKAIADLVGASDDLELSNEFFESAENLEDIALAAEGDIEAINRLGVAVGKDLIEAMEAVSREASGLDFSDADTEQAYANMVNQFYDAKSTVMAGLDELQAQINNLGIGENVYSILGGEEWVNALNTMAEQTHMSVDQMNSLLNSIGVQADVTVKHVPTQIEVPEYVTEEAVQPIQGGMVDSKGNSIPTAYRKTSRTWINGYKKVDGYIDVAQINTGDAIGTPPSITYVGNGPVSRSSTPVGRSKGGGGGGGGKSPKGSSGSNKDTKPKDKDKTEWDYLTDITNDLDRAAAAMEKLAKLEDRLYGANRISQIKKLQNEYKNYIKLLEQEVNLAKDHAQLLRTNAYDENGNLTINGYAYRAGFNQVNFDAQGNLENGKAIEAALVNIVNTRIDEYNAHRNDDDASYYEERVQLAQQDHEGFLKALSEYESTLGKIEEGQSEIQDYKEKIQDAADAIIDAIQEGIDDITEAIDSQRDFNKLYRDWMQGGSGYSHFDNQRRYYAEGLAGILSPTVDGGMSVFDMQLQNLQGRINDALDVIDGDSQDADDEKLSEQAAFENLQEATGAIMDNLNNIVDYYNSLLETIEEASSKMDELIDDRLESFDRLEDYLDTRLDQLKLLFGERSYEQQVQFYNEKIAVNTEKLASISTAIEAKQATVKALEELEASGKELSTEEREVLRNARDEVTSLQEKQLDTETQLLQDIADRLNSQLNAELDVTVSNLFGGEDIDWLSQQWELATRNSEQYLDDYNRAFELEKLQLKYQQLLNDTQDTSLVTQQRITEKMNEQLKYLREKKGLTEYDVQYAEKQLEILQRRIALEDAQSNKSQMRLQRNAAGNYDFVYGADEDAVNQAAQALLASQQEAYNLSKEIYKQTYESALRAAKEIKQMIIDTAMDASLTTEQQTERIKWLMDNLGEYLSNSSVELGEISVNLYNDIAGAEQLISEENLGHLAETFELMREQSTYTTEHVKEGLAETSSNIENSSAATFDTMQNQFGATKDSINGNLKDIELSVTNALGASSKATLGTLETIKQGTIDTTKGEKGIQGIILDVIGGIDENFKLSKENTLASVEEIDEGINKAYNNISGEGGYLDQYRNKTEETLDSAGDSYDSFTENSLNYTTEQLGILIETTDVWKEDLDTLNSIINDSASELKEWKGRGDAAIESAKKLITESNNIQISFGNLAVSSGITSETLYGFSDAAREAGYAVASMSNEIRDAYYSMQQAANAAAAAYQDMMNTANNAMYAANNATQAAIEAQNAMNNAGLYTTISSTASNIANNFKNKLSSGLSSLFHKKNNSGGDWYWDGYTYQYYGGYDTGGYTGSWSDRGVDDKSGKWAILHQKELVLNADDTKNMLSTVELVRDIMSGLKSTNSSLGKTISQSNLTDTVEQRVEISATFPGVQDAIEIKQALEQLADNAYQVASRYKY